MVREWSSCEGESPFYSPLGRDAVRRGLQECMSQEQLGSILIYAPLLSGKSFDMFYKKEFVKKIQRGQWFNLYTGHSDFNML